MVSCQRRWLPSSPAAAPGIGRAVAQRFADRRRQLRARREELRQARDTVLALDRPADHSICTGDVTKPELWDKLSLHFRDMAILVNAAGITQHRLLIRTQPETIDAIIDTNLKGTILGCKAAAIAMIKYKKGCIINISSLLGVRGGRGASAYAASKAGILGLTRSLAAELGGANIRVNAIIPGFVSDTGMTPGKHKLIYMLHKSPEIGEKVNSIPLRRMGTPEEIADAAAFLATNEYVSNCMLNIDGGYSAV
ncbi:hypothetical protein MAPG_00116 [Magnaporthiopsis poae ATCC 64411]|uniref:3-oxoacyl-[acyl-carrier-protein] reductase n=1 Tax=Magnaporthiopsis poae (strain ATCC 64411 / 73-15) TaxID=644358 RepID=A0A0C4DK54_MAGP6|nr:hypothetical protein MAPG_00116 [Magnaporthiopsis poae ATCC 64411]